MQTDIKTLLRDLGMSQRQAAKLLKVSEPTMSSWAGALRAGQFLRVPAVQARPLADLLGISPGLIRPDLYATAPASVA